MNAHIFVFVFLIYQIYISKTEAQWWNTGRPTGYQTVNITVTAEPTERCPWWGCPDTIETERVQTKEVTTGCPWWRDCQTTTELQTTAEATERRGWTEATTTDYPNVITSPPRNTAAKQGSSVHMDCRVSRLERDLLEWRVFTRDTDINGKVIFISSVGVLEPEKYHVHSDFQLGISNVNESDAGVYQCRLLITGTQYRAELTVMGPVVCSPPPYSGILQNRTIYLDCSAEYVGSVAPYMYWSPSRRYLRNYTSLGLARYQIQETADSYTDRRYFYCNLNFRSMSGYYPPYYYDSCYTYVTVYTPPHNIEFVHNNETVGPGTVQAQEGDVFYCLAQGYPSPSYEWTRQRGSGGPSYVYGNTLRITSAMNLETHAYICRAYSYIVGGYYSDSKTLTFALTGGPMHVVIPPKDTLAVEKNNVILNCTVNSNAASGWLEWYFNGTKLFTSKFPDVVASGYTIEGTYNLYIEQVTASHAGRYECRIYPNAQYYYADTVVIQGLLCSKHLSEYIPNSAKDMKDNKSAIEQKIPEVDWYSDNWTPRQGQFVMLACSVNYVGRKMPNIGWYNDATGTMKSWKSYWGDKLIASAYIVASSRFHNTRFQCTVDLDEDSNALQCGGFMTVHYLKGVNLQPDSKHVYGGVLHLHVGERIQCGYEGNPLPKAAWHKILGAGPEIVDGAFLQVSDAMKRSLNIYECRVWNEDSIIELEKRQMTQFYVT